MTRRINVDVTNAAGLSYVTGIQRVVREICLRLIESPELEVRLLEFDAQSHRYFILEQRSFLERILHRGTRDLEVLGSIAIQDLGPADIFYDVDAAWNSPLSRASLYPLLREQGVFIATTIYDLVPVNRPEYAHADTIRSWTSFLAAVYAYSHLAMPISRATEIDFQELAENLDLKRTIPSIVTKLGGEILVGGDPTQEELRSCESFADARYIVFVGTVEPRKQHLTALRAFQEVCESIDDVHLVFVGKVGWHSDETVAAIQQHPLYGSRVHWLQSASDELVMHLYRDAYLAIYLSSFEGYGLPVAESLGSGTVTVTSNNSSIFEVGHVFADYIQHDSWKELADTLSLYLNDTQLHAARREFIRKSYRPLSWDTVTDTVRAVFLGIDSPRPKIPEKIPFILISNDADRTRETVESWSSSCDWVDRFYVVAPADMEDSIRADVTTPIVFVAEEGLLGSSLAEFKSAGHQRKNWMLRSRMSKIRDLADVVIALDDDSRPLGVVERSKFVNQDGSFNSYYSHDLSKWPHRESNFDYGQAETMRVLSAAGFELLGYAAHQPQILHLPTLKKAVELFEESDPSASLDEWSTYFNFLSTRFPTWVRKKVFETLNWPGSPSDWDRQYIPRVYFARNHYQELFDTGMFRALPERPTPESLSEVAIEEFASHEANSKLWRRFDRRLGSAGLVRGLVGFRASSESLRVYISGLPRAVVSVIGKMVRLELFFHIQSSEQDATQIFLGYEIGGTVVTKVRIPLDSSSGFASGVLSMPVYAQFHEPTEANFVILLGSDERDAVHIAGPRFRICAVEQANLGNAMAQVEDLFLAHYKPLAVNAEGGTAEVFAQQLPVAKRGRRIRKAAKRLLKWALPWVSVERQRFHDLTTTVGAIHDLNLQLLSRIDALEQAQGAKYATAADIEAWRAQGEPPR